MFPVTAVLSLLQILDTFERYQGGFVKGDIKKIHVCPTSASFFSVAIMFVRTSVRWCQHPKGGCSVVTDSGLRFLHKTTFSSGSHVPSDTVPLLDVDDLLLLSPFFKTLSLRELL